MDPVIAAQIENLRKKYPTEEDQALFSQWEKTVKKSSLYLDLKNHGAFKLIVDAYQAELVKINKELSTNKDLFTKEEGRHLGLLLHERKRFITDFLRPFIEAEMNQGYVKNEINRNLNPEVE